MTDRAARATLPGTAIGARRDPWAVAAWAGAIAVGILALGLSLWRLMPGFGFWDTAEFQTVLPVLGTAHPTGYPTYVVVGWLASVLLQPLGEPALRMNVLSALLVGAGAAISVDLARRVSGSLVLGIVAGIGIALTPIVWAVGTHADPHALHFLFVVTILSLLVRWEDARRGSPVDSAIAPMVDRRRADRYLIAAAVVVGLSVGNHSLTFLFGPPILVFVLAVDPGILRRPRLVVAAAAAFLIPTVLVRFEMVLRAGWFRAPFVYADPSTWSGFWYVTLGEQFHGWFTDPSTGWSKRIGDLVTMAVGQLGALAPVVGIAFLVAAIRRPRYALLSGLTLAITCLFNAVYPDGAIDRYYIGPVVICWTWLALLGATFVDAVTGRPFATAASIDDEQDRAALGPDAATAAGVDTDTTDDGGARGLGGAGIVRVIGLAVVGALLLAPSALAFPTRAQLVDRSGDRLAQRWTDEVLSAVEPNAVIVSWWSYSTPLWYATIVDHRRTDISIIDDRTRLDCNLGELDHVIDLYLPTHPVYLIRNGTSELPALQNRFRLVPIGGALSSNVIRVLPLSDTAEGAPGTAPEPPACAAIQG